MIVYIEHFKNIRFIINRHEEDIDTLMCKLEETLTCSMNEVRSLGTQLRVNFLNEKYINRQRLQNKQLVDQCKGNSFRLCNMARTILEYDDYYYMSSINEFNN